MFFLSRPIAGRVSSLVASKSVPRFNSLVENEEENDKKKKGEEEEEEEGRKERR